MSIYKSIYKQDGSLGQITSDLIRLRKKLGTLQAKKVAGVPYAVKNAKELMLKVRDAADDLGMLMAGSPVDVQMTHEPTDRGSKVHVIGTYRWMSSDGTYVDFVGVGTGMSTDDKSAGKASTYAWKESAVKALSLPDAEMVDSDDEALGPDVYGLIGRIEKCQTEAELRALKGELSGLEEHERVAVMPVYIKVAGLVKGK